MKKLFIFLSIMLCCAGQAMADIHDPVQRIDRSSVAGYYTDAEREEGTIIFTRDHRTRNNVKIELTRDTGDIVERNINGRTFTFRDLVKKKLELDFSEAEPLSEGETQELVIDLNHEECFGNPDGLEITGVRLENNRNPHEIKIKTWFLDRDVIAKIIIKNQ